ncbi:hypothetical protein P4S72_12870 [Vibrio sp. PP-XX7]
MSFYWMQVLVELIECWMGPISRYLTKNRYLTALRDGFQLAMPFVIVGSLCVPFLYPPLVLDDHNRFTALWHLISSQYRMLWLAPYQITLGIVSLLVSFGMAASLAKHYGLPGTAMWPDGMCRLFTVSRI